MASGRIVQVIDAIRWRGSPLVCFANYKLKENVRYV